MDHEKAGECIREEGGEGCRAEETDLHETLVTFSPEAERDAGWKGGRGTEGEGGGRREGGKKEQGS